MSCFLTVEGKSFWFFPNRVFPFLRSPPGRMLLSFLLIGHAHLRSLSPPHLAGPRGAGRQAGPTRVSWFCLFRISLFFWSRHPNCPERDRHISPALGSHRSGGDDVTHSAHGKHVTPPGQSEHRIPGLGDWCHLGQVTPSELRLWRTSESVSAGLGSGAASLVLSEHETWMAHGPHRECGSHLCPSQAA